jgi:hypothetical protein
VELRSSDSLHFLHIPKTGGTTLYEILAGQFAESQVFPRSAEESLIEVRQTAAGGRYRLTRMHQDYSIYCQFPRKPLFVTMLRSPVDRVVSLYGHLQRDPGHPLHSYLIEHQLDLRGFCMDPVFRQQVQNAQVRYLVGTREGSNLSSDATLAIAKIRLDEFAFFGLVERFPESIHLLFHAFGWPEVEFAALNVRPDSPPPAIDAPTRQLIQSLTELDRELYNYAWGLFDRRLRQMIEEIWAEQPKGRLTLRTIELVLRRSNSLKRLTDPSRIQLSRLRRMLIPEGSRLEAVSVGLRKRLLGW